MPKSKNNPLKIAKELGERIIQHYEAEDFPGPRFVVAQSLQHLSASTKYSMQIETLDPLMVAYFGSMNGDAQTILIFLRLAWMKAWLFEDKDCVRMLKPYYKSFKDSLCDYLKSRPTKEEAIEKLDAEPDSGNVYRQAFFRYKSCISYPELFKVEYISTMPFNLDWMGAYFCHLANVYRPDLSDEVTKELVRHPGFIGHLAEISDEYRPKSA